MCVEKPWVTRIGLKKKKIDAKETEKKTSYYFPSLWTFAPFLLFFYYLFSLFSPYFSFSFCISLLPSIICHNTPCFFSFSFSFAYYYHCYFQHLFFVNLSNGPTLRESDAVLAGENIVAPVKTPFGSVGLQICYDLRFPEVSRHQRALGATLLTYPSAFTVPTGQAHWGVTRKNNQIK